MIKEHTSELTALNPPSEVPRDVRVYQEKDARESENISLLVRKKGD